VLLKGRNSIRNCQEGGECVSRVAPPSEGKQTPAVTKQRRIIRPWRVKNTRLGSMDGKDELIKHLL